MGAACTSTWFNRKRSFAIGLVASGSSVGAVILPIILERLIPRIGFGWAVRAVALVQLATLAIANVIMRSRLPPRKSGPLLEPRAFLQPSYTLWTIAGFFAFWGLYTPLFYCASFAAKVGAPPSLAAYILSIINVIRQIGYELMKGLVNPRTNPSKHCGGRMGSQ